MNTQTLEHMNTIICPFLFLTAFNLALTACSQNDDLDKKLENILKYSVPIIKVEEALTQEQKDNVYFLDTRSNEEYLVSHIPNAIWTGFDKFDIQKVLDIPKDALIITYCSVGYRSEKIGEKLQESGYKNVRNLYGGIFEWVNQGNEVYNKFDQPTDSVHTYNRNWAKYLKRGIKVF